MIRRDDDAATVRFPPPLVYLTGIAGGVLLHALVVPFDLALTLPARIAITAMIGGLGLVLMAAALGAFRRTGQDPKPWKVTPEIVSTGAYRFTRNPMYVSMALLQAGLATALSNGWMLALTPMWLGVVYVTAVRHEEAYLEAKFGEAYATYKQSVRRWL